MTAENKTEKRKWDGTGYEPDPLLWDRLGQELPEEICQRALVSYSNESGFVLPFLHQTFHVFPEKRAVVSRYDHAPQDASFELELILLTYLVRSQALELSGELINEKQLPGGETFFRGPHRLSTGPLEQVFGEDRIAFLSTGERLHGTVMDLGDAAVSLPVFPRVPVVLTLWEKDDEFPARITVNFDATVSSHLPLDIIWATIHVVSQWMVPFDRVTSSLRSGSN